MGIASAFLGGVVALLALPIFCCFDTGRPNSVFKLCLMPLALLAWLFFLIAWALLAKVRQHFTFISSRTQLQSN